MNAESARFLATQDERADLAEQLRDQDIVAGEPDLAAALARVVTITSFTSGEDLLIEGEATDHMLFVLGGAVEIIIGGNSVATIPGKCLVGEMALFQPEPRRSATVRAAQMTVCAELSAAAFKRLIMEYPQALQRMIKVIRDRDPNAAVTLIET